MSFAKYLKRCRNSKIVSAIFVLSCSIGFAMQTRKICQEYFNYVTITKTTTAMPSVLVTPRLVFCPRFVDILDRRNASAYGILRQQPQSFEEIMGDYGKLTI